MSTTSDEINQTPCDLVTGCDHPVTTFSLVVAAISRVGHMVTRIFSKLIWVLERVGRRVVEIGHRKPVNNGGGHTVPPVTLVTNQKRDSDYWRRSMYCTICDDYGHNQWDHELRSDDPPSLRGSPATPFGLSSDPAPHGHKDQVFPAPLK